jgi:NADPH:quinone reductase-like Zn-dependent oxidoreductase
VSSLPASTRAVVLREFGDPSVLRLEELPMPVPGPGEVLLRVGAVSINRSFDLRVRQDGDGRE